MRKPKNLPIDSIPRPKKRKLKAKWTVELSDDIQAFHGSAAEKLVRTMAKAIQKEIDQEIINALTDQMDEALVLDKLSEVDKIMVKMGYPLNKFVKVPVTKESINIK